MLTAPTATLKVYSHLVGVLRKLNMVICDDGLPYYLQWCYIKQTCVTSFVNAYNYSIHDMLDILQLVIQSSGYNNTQVQEMNEWDKLKISLILKSTHLFIPSVHHSVLCHSCFLAHNHPKQVNSTQMLHNMEEYRIGSKTWSAAVQRWSSCRQKLQQPWHSRSV